MIRLAPCHAALCVLLLAGCAAPSRREAVTAHQGQEHWAAVLVAGDGSIPVFDNATGQMAALLEAVGTPGDDVHRLSASPDILAQPHVQLASKARVLETIANLHPAPGQACFVYMTSHGAHGAGLYLAPHREFISPADLDEALESGCGTAPTVAIVSACYTGSFAQPPMTRPNRIVLTAAAADRPSFGCGAGQQLAFYDDCLLNTLGSLPHDWPDVINGTKRCVTGLEAKDHEQPSDPQGAVGAATARIRVPG